MWQLAAVFQMVFGVSRQISHRVLCYDYWLESIVFKFSEFSELLFLCMINSVY